jgi:hypothetical protein
MMRFRRSGLLVPDEYLDVPADMKVWKVIRNKTGKLRGLERTLLIPPIPTHEGRRAVRFGKGGIVHIIDELPEIAGGSRQYFAETLAPIMTADQASVTGTTEAALWPVSPWTGTVPNQLQPGQIYRLSVSGGITSAASAPGTVTLTPRWGTSTAGTALGASTASATLTTSKTSPYWMEMMAICRTIGTAGTLTINGDLASDPTTNGIGISGIAFGNNAAQGNAGTSIDTTTAQGFFMGITLGSASDSAWTRLVVVEALN